MEYRIIYNSQRPDLYKQWSRYLIGNGFEPGDEFKGNGNNQFSVITFDFVDQEIKFLGSEFEGEVITMKFDLDGDWVEGIPEGPRTFCKSI